MAHYDAVVVGLGAVGSFAMRALSKTPGRWLGVERYSLGSHGHGSSHGKTRIYRRAYFEHPHYVPWIDHSLREFREMQESPQYPDLIEECGMLLMAPKGSGKNRDDLPPLLAASNLAASQHDITVDFLDATRLKETFPQFCYNHEMVGLLEPGAGILRPERIIQAAQAEAQNSGYATMLEHTVVADIQRRSDNMLAVRLINYGASQNGRESQPEEEEIVASTVLLSAGAWMSNLVPQWAPHLTVTRQIQGWIDTSEYGHEYSLDQMPAWFMETPGWQVPVYGVPADPTASGSMKHWIKVGTHCNPEEIRDPTFSPSVVTSDEYAQLRHTTMLGLDPRAWAGHDAPQFVAAEPCLYTMTPDSHFIIASPVPNIFGVSACSGHGFKMSPALGEMMSDFAQGKPMAKWRLDFCSPDRFT